MEDLSSRQQATSLSGSFISHKLPTGNSKSCGVGLEGVKAIVINLQILKTIKMSSPVSPSLPISATVSLVDQLASDTYLWC